MTRPLAVYVHIPFCTYKCGYCDFNAYAGLDALKLDYGQALLREIEADRPLLEGRTVTSIGFGGGTPSEVPPAQIAAVIDAEAGIGSLARDAEVTLEANPGTCTAEAFRDLRAAGVNRLSLGAQSFHAAELRFLDRIHSPEANAAAVRLARVAGFENIGLDLIYGLPGQSPASWAASLDAALALAPEHISTYALTVEEGTPLARRVAKGEVQPLDEDLVADQYELATERLSAAGYEQYELSNWARAGFESRHNCTYWTDGDYLGLGAGAHGYLGGERYENAAHPRDYIAAAVGVAVPLPASLKRYTPSPATAMSDWLGLRLRLLTGFRPQEFEAKFAVALEAAVGPVLQECLDAGILVRDPRIRLTRRGRLLHGEVAARMLAHLEAVPPQVAACPS